VVNAFCFLLPRVIFGTHETCLIAVAIAVNQGIKGIKGIKLKLQVDDLHLQFEVGDLRSLSPPAKPRAIKGAKGQRPATKSNKKVRSQKSKITAKPKPRKPRPANVAKFGWIKGS
jgi:hypothetical protein